jgi:hypothetical protein
MSVKTRRVYQERRNKFKHTCGRKRRYDSDAAALKALTDMHEHTGNGAGMGIYKCPYGAHWHFGHSPGSRTKTAENTP